MVDSNVLKNNPNRVLMMITQDQKTGKNESKLVITTEKSSIVKDQIGGEIINIDELVENQISVFLNPIQ